MNEKPAIRVMEVVPHNPLWKNHFLNEADKISKIIKDEIINIYRALGMWFDEQNKYAYLEPLATVPKYRHMGLATIALTEAMKKTKALGAKYCFGGDGEFYTAMGFETVMNRELWKKEW